MSWLLAIGLKNAILALPLAALALAASRWSRRPALAHVLWAVVLIKLLTPPLIDVPVGWKLDVENWLAADRSGSAAQLETSSPAAADHQRRWGASRSLVTGKGNPAQSANRGNNSRAARKQARSNDEASAPRTSLATSAWSWLASRAAWPVLALIVWAVGSLTLLGLFFTRAWRFCRYLRLATGRDEYLGPRVAELAHLVGITIPPRVIVVDGIVSPMLWGLGQRACLIFPSQLARRLSPANLDALLLHELAHYWRGDHWMRALELAAYTLFWWNPVVWWARREIEAAEEECCDAWVVEHQRGTRISYAEALLTTIDFLCERPPPLPPVACGLGEVQLLRVRLTQIMRGQVAAGMSRWLQVAVIAAGLAISPLEPALWATSAPSPSRPARMPAAQPAAAPASKLAATSAQTETRTRRASPSPGLRAVATASLRQAPIFPVAPPRPAVTHWGTAVSPNGKYQLEARSGGRIALAGTQDSFRVDLSAHLIRCVSFAPDSSTFATGHPDALVRLWDSESGVLKMSLSGSQAAITTVHISPDGKQVAAGASDGSVFVWEVTRGDVLAQLPPQVAAVSCLRWSHRGDRLAVTLGTFLDYENSSLLLWTPQENVVVREQPLDKPAGAMDWLGADDALIVADWSGHASLSSVATGEVTGQWQVDKDLVSAAAWSPDCPLVTRYLADQFLTGSQP